MVGERHRAAVRYGVVSALCLFMAQELLFAQTASGILKSWSDGIGKLLIILMGIGALVSLAFFIYHVISDRPQDAKKLVLSFVGYAVAAALLLVVQRYTGSIKVGNGGGGFNDIKFFVQSILLAALGIVGMISLTSISIRIIAGDEQSFRKLFVWLAALVIGSAILNAV